MGGSTELSEREAEFLAYCEETFKNRFQKGDMEYDREFDKVLTPPIVAPWSVNQRRGYNNHRGNRRRSWSRDRDDGRRDSRGWSRQNWRDYERRGQRDEERRRYHDDQRRPYENRHGAREDRNQRYDHRRDYRDRDRDGGSTYNDGQQSYERRDRD